MIRGVLFDMDGVLLDSERIGQEILKAAWSGMGYDMPGEVYAQLLGATHERCREITREAMGPFFPYEEGMAIYREKLMELARTGRMPLKPGVAECFQGLKARGLRMALATSTSRPSVETYFANIPALSDVFDATVCGGEAGRSKPAPDIYLEAARRIGVAPENCIGVEDSRAGLRSLTDAGCVSVMVPDLLPYDDSLAGTVNHRLDSLHQLCGLIDRLNLSARVKA